ncbi:hypothetical protein [Geofilum rubicundum]|uniref:Outer membrane protein n=1 Tax=Geofilum rubicundum JCM 15548 TaxID=1236989 RepID=A0A0E9M2B0_9BACT|nr:hypothetical protein [Geofilum rubicundum]GAO31738.1 hypothetical protein JCM15548_14132 [Geofilum rubicundum JCM 15548]
MKNLSLLLAVFLVGVTQMSLAQRNFDNAHLTYCQRTGKAIYMYDANFVKLGMVRPHSEMGRGNEYPAAGLTDEGIMAQFGFMRYLDLDINRSRFGIGYYVPLYAAYHPGKKVPWTICPNWSAVPIYLLVPVWVPYSPFVCLTVSYWICMPLPNLRCPFTVDTCMRMPG